MLKWLTDHVSVFKIQHDAHLEFRMSVAQHLAHRERIGDAPIFVAAHDRATCIERDTLWELRVILADGSAFDIAGSTLENCIQATKPLVTRVLEAA